MKCLRPTTGARSSTWSPVSAACTSWHAYNMHSPRHLDAELLRARERLVVHPAHVLLGVGVKVLRAALVLPLDQVRVLYAVRGRPARCTHSIWQNPKTQNALPVAPCISP